MKNVKMKKSSLGNLKYKIGVGRDSIVDQEDSLIWKRILGLAVTQKKGNYYCAGCGVKVINMPEWKQHHLDNCPKDNPQ